MRIWRNFKLLTEAMPNLRNRGCWQQCNQCKRKWSKTNTKYIHMTVNEANDTRYLCDNCLIEVDSKKDA